jgi:hypothetical protein
VNRAKKLLRLVVEAVREEATDQEIPKRLYDKDIATLMGSKPGAFSAWIREGPCYPKQISSLLFLLDFLKPDKVMEIFSKHEILCRRMLKNEPALNPDSLKKKGQKAKDSKKKTDSRIRFQIGQ